MIHNALTGERLDTPDPEREAKFRDEMRALAESCTHDDESFCIRCLVDHVLDKKRNAA